MPHAQGGSLKGEDPLCGPTLPHQTFFLPKPMSEEINFVKDLATILISAGLFTVICKALKQPSILGYIIAGFLISPNLGIFGISSMETVEQWSEIGMIFLMFGLGLEFSLKKLLAVGGGAVTIAGSKFLGVFAVGFVVGQAMGWTVMESVFLAGLLSMSSTAVIIKSYDELGLKEKPFASMVFGSLVVEDIIAVLLMVLLSTLAVSNKFAGGEMLAALVKLSFFLILWFLVGIYVIPSVLRWARKYINDEILLIVSLGLCFGMVTLATAAGFSSALGAFVMGSILAETIEGEHIEKLTVPIKDLFGAVFFTSVGMMISPSVIVEHWGTILIITIVVLLFDSLFAGLGVIFSGGGLSNAVHAGFSLAQLGEFAFIIASVGVSLGVMREFIYPVIIAVSVITIFLSPYMIKASDKVYTVLKKVLPSSWVERIDAPKKSAPSTSAEKGEWKNFLKWYLIRFVLYGVLTFAVMILGDILLPALSDKLLPSSFGQGVKGLICVGVTLGVMLPFLWGMVVPGKSTLKSATKLIEEKPFNKWPVFSVLLAGVMVAILMVFAVISSHISLSWWSLLLLAIGAGAFALSAKRMKKDISGASLEEKFLRNFNAIEDMERAAKPVSTSVRDSLGNYDVHIESITVSPDSSYIGVKMKDIPIRQDSGANIIKIVRGSSSTTIPDGDFRIYPYDRMLAVGTPKQISLLKGMMEKSQKEASPDQKGENFKVESFTLDKDSYLVGKSLRSVRMRDYGCMLISILKGEEFITNPKSDLVFEEGDTVWIAGDSSGCDWFKK